MAIKVAAIGTGNVGRHALSQLITDARFELTGVWGIRTTLDLPLITGKGLYAG